MELFDKKFVHFMWDDKLEGKRGFIAKSVKDLKGVVNANFCKELIRNSHDDAYPFLATDDNKYHFAYYDPNYEVKKAFNEGKTIQFLSRQQQLTGEWIDVWYDCIGPDEPKFLETVEYRVKPEDEKWVVYLAGAKAHQVKWHDLRKDPNDLPPCKESGIISRAMMTDKGKWAVYDFRRKEWYTSLSNRVEVTQWCDLELPKENEA